MVLSIDGFEVLKAMTARSSAFPDITTDLNKSVDALSKTARTLVIKQVKHKNTSILKIRAVLEAIGISNFKLIIDGVPDAQIKTLVGKLDNHPEIKSETAQWRRQHLIALIDGSKEPTPKATKPSSRTAAPKKSSTKKAKAQPASEFETLDYSSAGAQRKR